MTDHSFSHLFLFFFGLASTRSVFAQLPACVHLSRALWPTRELKTARDGEERGRRFVILLSMLCHSTRGGGIVRFPYLSTLRRGFESRGRQSNSACCVLQYIPKWLGVPALAVAPDRPTV